MTQPTAQPLSPELVPASTCVEQRLWRSALALLVLDFSGYVPNSALQPASAVQGIRLVAGPIPAVLLCMGLLFAAFYPLKRENYTAIAQGLEARRRASLAEET